MRVNWKDVQQRPGRLDPCEHWKQTVDLARTYQERVGFRVMLCNPDLPDLALPDFVRSKAPLAKRGEWRGCTRYEPRYDHPAFQAAFGELVYLLAAAYDGHPDVEYADTCMYGFWSEGHTWALESDSFPDSVIAEKTFADMFQHPVERWKKTPFVTNTQPDFSKVVNSELHDRAVRIFNWLRTDTIFIENDPVQELSHRPP